ncbi:MAG: 16S rRNA (guanine(527)-N(7))-methyltransferase RsmG [Spirochaetales bacterium]|nr:16S rRNA (guanine(527)-N(7))-methyltransferase RsmG [Spirochaetales bacterium]
MKWSEREEAALKKGLISLGLDSEGDIFNKLNLYARELLLWNKTHGLVGLGDDPVELVDKHILDSLAALPFIGTPETLADIGSGAGLPGIPLAICLPETRVFLVEKMGRRCDFLRNAVIVTGIADRVEVVQKTLEKSDGTFEVVTLRAFAPLPRVIDSLLDITADGGRILAYKGRVETFKEELNPAWNSSWENLKVPGLDAERNLVIIKK